MPPNARLLSLVILTNDNNREVPNAMTVMGPPSTKTGDNSTKAIATDEALEHQLARLYTPITELELSDALRLMRNSAPGPDGVSLRRLVSADPLKILVVFNKLFSARKIPNELRGCSRTILIPKKAEGLSDQGCWD